MRSPTTARGAAAAALILTVAACSSAATTSTAEAEQDVVPAQLGHVHGVGLNPTDGLVYAATHHGLFVVDGPTTRRVGEGRQDTMGFTVTGPDSFLASGHPAPGQDGPANVGLLASQDAGATWETVSGQGSDFHALTATGDHVYGLDSATGVLSRSSDGGLTWQDGAPLPARAVDADPARAATLLATTETGLVVSDDGGVTFSAHPVQPPERLVLIDHVPADGPGSSLVTVAGLDETGQLWTFDGRTWSGSGVSQGGVPEAFAATSADGYLAAFDARIYRSDDAGRSWHPVGTAAGRTAG